MFYFFLFKTVLRGRTVIFPPTLIQRIFYAEESNRVGSRAASSRILIIARARARILLRCWNVNRIPRNTSTGCPESVSRRSEAKREKRGGRRKEGFRAAGNNDERGKATGRRHPSSIEVVVKYANLRQCYTILYV